MIRIRDLLNPLKKSNNEPEIDNAAILKENEDFYKLAYEELHNRNHKMVLKTLIYFIENDLYLRRNIGKILNSQGLDNDLNKGKEYIVDEITFAQHVELQSYYNSFRNTLMGDIVAYIVKSYNNVGKNIGDYKTASMWYNYSEKVNEYYINALRYDLIEKGKTRPDEYLSKMYYEIINAFEELKNLSFRTIRKIMKQTLEDSKLPQTLWID